MLDLRPVLFVIGLLLSVVALAMLLPAAVDAAAGHKDWQVFLASGMVTLFVSVTMILATRSRLTSFSLRQAFIMTNLAWVVIALFGSLPFAFSELEMSWTDSLFESMSGITTTGATVIVGLDNAPPGILLWRAVLQWLGGIGIIVMAIAVLPVLQVGGMQLFRVEAFEADKVLPRAAQIAAGICLIYFGLTVGAALVLWFFGMSGFDAITHAMTAIATGGYSTSDASVAKFDSAWIDWAITLMMILGSLPFVLYLRFLRGSWQSLLRDSQVRWFLALLSFAVVSVSGWLWWTGLMPIDQALRYGAFNTTSMMTGTGYSTADFDQWGGLVMPLMFILMFVGGCAGSTTCGVKIFRVQVLYATAGAQLRRLMQPSGVFFPYYNKKPIPEQVAESVMSFFFLFIGSFALLAVGLGLCGLDFITAISGAASAIANVGPGLGDVIGPVGNYSSLPDPAKWILSAGMLLGRLEVFTILILFMPTFWRG